MAERDRDRPDGKRPRRPGRDHRAGKRQAGQPGDRRHGSQDRREERPRGDHGSSDDRRYDDGRRDRQPRGEDGVVRGKDREAADRPRGGHRPPYPGGPRRPPPGRPAHHARPRAHPTVQREDLIGEGEELVAGRRPVEEAFAARRDALRLLIVPERRAALDALAIHATTLRIPVVELEGGTLTALAGFDGHQGVALVARQRPPGTLEDLLERARQRGEKPFVLVLDSLEDPQNFGTLLRSAEACGVHGVIYPTRRSAPLSAAAIKASAGATEHLILVPVSDLPGALADLHADGLRICGADERASLDYADADLRGPLAIVVGSEGRGISGPVRRRLDLTVRIPMRGKIASLNAAVAGSILLFAVAAQRPSQPTPSTTPAEP